MFTDLVELDGGSFRMGSTRFYPEEAPVHAVTVAPFAVERHPVTNAQFGEFVADTGYRTVAEVAPDPALFPGAAPEDLVPGALVFRATSGPVDLRDWRQWWDWTPGASWRHPYGPDSSIEAGPSIRWCRCATPMRRPTPAGRAGGCRPKRNGSSRPGPGRQRPTPGARTPPPAGS